MTSKNQQTEEKGSRYFQQHCLFYIDLQSEFYDYLVGVFFVYLIWIFPVTSVTKKQHVSSATYVYKAITRQEVKISNFITIDNSGIDLVTQFLLI